MIGDALLDGDRQIALAYAKAEWREGFRALLTLDVTLGNALRFAREPILAQVRLGWWRDRLEKFPDVSAENEPAFHSIAAIFRRHDINVDPLVNLVNGWETLLNDLPLGRETLNEYAELRGGGLFRSAALIAGTGDPARVEAAGKLWALTDLSRYVSDQETALRAESLARMHGECARDMPRMMRPFAILTRFAERDLAVLPEMRAKSGSPSRMIQALGFVAFRL